MLNFDSNMLTSYLQMWYEWKFIIRHLLVIGLGDTACSAVAICEMLPYHSAYRMLHKSTLQRAVLGLSYASDWSCVGSARLAPPTVWRAECPLCQYGASFRRARRSWISLHLEAGRGGVAEQWAAGEDWCAVCSEIRGDQSCLIRMESDKLIGMEALTNVDSRAWPGHNELLACHRIHHFLLLSWCYCTRWTSFWDYFFTKMSRTA